MNFKILNLNHRISILFFILFCSSTFGETCTLPLNTTNIPLPDLGASIYKGYRGGLYSDGRNIAPVSHLLSGTQVANEIVFPLNSNGVRDLTKGKVVMISIGMSNTSSEFGGSGIPNPEYSFKLRADNDPSKHKQLVIVNGAQNGKASTNWADVKSGPWKELDSRLLEAGVNPSQVQIAWIKIAMKTPGSIGAFPLHANALLSDLRVIVQKAKTRYQNLAIIYLSSRTHAFTDDPTSLNPEPYAYESAFSVKWLIDEQINGGLNFDPKKGNVVSPYLTWGPYLWANDSPARSDGLTWLRTDVAGDCTHPSALGVKKVADELIAFFKTSPLSTPWFLKKEIQGEPPQVSLAASTIMGAPPLMVQFSSSATDPDGTPSQYAFSFDDGTTSLIPNPVKTFHGLGGHNVRLTVTDNSGNTAIREISIHVTSEPTPELPPSTIPQDLSLAEDNSLDLTLSATDPEGEPLSYSTVTTPTHGVLTGNPPLLTYTPHLNYFGPDEFKFKANDGQLDSNISTVKFNITPVNDLPTIHVPTTLEFLSGTEISFPVSVSDPDLDTLLVTLENPVQGSVIKDTNGWTFKWLPEGTQSGTHNINFRVSDGIASQSGQTTVNLTSTLVGIQDLSPINQPPQSTKKTSGCGAVHKIDPFSPDRTDLSQLMLIMFWILSVGFQRKLVNSFLSYLQKYDKI